MPLLSPFTRFKVDMDEQEIPGAAKSKAKADDVARQNWIRVKNRRKRYLDTHPEYFGPELELADPILYDRLIRQYQTPAEREAEGRAKGYSGMLEADLMRAYAKRDAISHPDPNAMFQYKRGPQGEVLPDEEEDESEKPDKEGAFKIWKWEMEMRFVHGHDKDFDYQSVDYNEDYDDRAEQEREIEDAYYAEEEPKFEREDGKEPQGETGIQDY